MKGQISIVFLIFFTFAIIIFGILISSGLEFSKKVKGYAEFIKLNYVRNYNSLKKYVMNRTTKESIFCDKYLNDCLTRHHYG